MAATLGSSFARYWTAAAISSFGSSVTWSHPGAVAHQDPTDLDACRRPGAVRCLLCLRVRRDPVITSVWYPALESCAPTRASIKVTPRPRLLDRRSGTG